MNSCTEYTDIKSLAFPGRFKKHPGFLVLPRDGHCCWMPLGPQKNRWRQARSSRKIGLETDGLKWGVTCKDCGQQAQTDSLWNIVHSPKKEKYMLHYQPCKHMFIQTTTHILSPQNVCFKPVEKRRLSWGISYWLLHKEASVSIEPNSLPSDRLIIYLEVQDT